MWAFIFLCVVGSNICQAAEGDSTQMYYAKLTADESAIEKIAERLGSFQHDDTVQVEDLKMTTICQNHLAGMESSMNCSCESSFRWSDEVCLSDNTCCGHNSCTFPEKSTHMCVSNTSVTIEGSIHLKEEKYQGCLAEEKEEEFQECNSNLLTDIKKVYSTLKGFDVFKITGYRTGSIIADFEMTIANEISPQDLMTKTENLAKNITGVLNLVSTGVVSIHMPDNPVSYNSEQTLMCETAKEVNTSAVWRLNQTGTQFDIINGTVSIVTADSGTTRLTLRNITEVWAGEYTCAYHQKGASCSIFHTASAVMDVSILPIIVITADPQFPHCRERGALDVLVTGRCEISESHEVYDVKWTKENPSARLTNLKPSNSSGKVVYAASTSVSCIKSETITRLWCTFTNRRNQSRKASVDVNVIYADDPFCPEDGEWKNTKAGFNAKLPCKDADGERLRLCKKDEESSLWKFGNEESQCVNKDMSSLLQDANFVDIGRGKEDENAASVFTRFAHVTHDTVAINSSANMRTSVSILSTLKDRLKHINNDTTLNDFLESSSNLLNESLKRSWDTESNNLSLAETYLESVEDLIKKTNITSVNRKPNLEVSKCNSSKEAPCRNSVFNATVSFRGAANNNVKTTGFKELQNYLPMKDGFLPNSIVVSTTTTEITEEVDVEITFPLLKQRPRNVNIQCVWWDYNTSQWSDKGCEWKGADGQRQLCSCEHLSSFAIMMSKEPLNVTGLTEITYVGLSISVVSLAISLVIELIVWSAVVKTNTLYLRHTAHVNISLCLLIANCCFLASSKPQEIPEIWCKAFVVLKHFCYLCMFFWMLCLSTTLLHQAVFLFHNVSKKHYLRFSLLLGYVCPLIIVVITFVANNGEKDQYYNRETCWLVYNGVLKGSLHAFIIPVGIIVIINVFSMLVVIMKLLDHPKSTDKSNEKDRTAAKTVLRTVILLTPIFGITWIFGFGVTLLDLTDGNIASAVNYIFVLLNSFQGFFILLTTTLGDKLTREALLKRARNNVLSESISERLTKESSVGK